MTNELPSKNPGNLFILTGLSGVGKTTLAQLLLKDTSWVIPLRRVITHTSRPMRSNEIQDQDYHFISPLEFEHKIKEDFFIEWVKTNYYYGIAYSSLQTLIKGINLLIVVDLAGCRKLQQLMPQAIAITIQAGLSPQDELATIQQRLIERNTEKDEFLAQRLQLAAQEQQAHRDYPFSFRIINKDLEESFSKLKEIINNHSDLSFNNSQEKR